LLIYRPFEAVAVHPFLNLGDSSLVGDHVARSPVGAAHAVGCPHGACVREKTREKGGERGGESVSTQLGRGQV
jgi:hypothetical protein